MSKKIRNSDKWFNIKDKLKTWKLNAMPNPALGPGSFFKYYKRHYQGLMLIKFLDKNIVTMLNFQLFIIVLLLFK